MNDFQQRVVDENAALKDKISKLGVFIDESPIFKKLPAEEQARLKVQLFHMTAYAHALAQRIAAFGD